MRPLLLALPLLLAACRPPEPPVTLWQITGTNKQYQEMAEWGHVQYLRSTSPGGDLVGNNEYQCGYVFKGGRVVDMVYGKTCLFATLGEIPRLPEELQGKGITHYLKFPMGEIGAITVIYLKKVGEEWQGYAYADTPFLPDGMITIRRWK